MSRGRNTKNSMMEKERKRRMRLMEKSYSLLFSFKIFPASSGFWVDQRNITEHEIVDSQYGWLTCAICTYNTRQGPIPHFAHNLLPYSSFARSEKGTAGHLRCRKQTSSGSL